MSILIADSGASKTAWAWVRGATVQTRMTRGLHTSWIDDIALAEELRQELQGMEPEEIRFYGAGLYGSAQNPVRTLLEEIFGPVRIEFRDDLQAVADAFLQERSGVAAILGTGSNSGWFEQGVLKQRVAALGYVLGDEGSGADIGKALLKGYFRKDWDLQTDRWLASLLDGLTYEEMVRHLYRETRPSYWLATLAGKLLKAEDRPAPLSELIDQALDRFVLEHLRRYDAFPDMEVAICGGVANACSDQLAEKLTRRGVKRFHLDRGVLDALVAAELKRQQRTR